MDVLKLRIPGPRIALFVFGLNAGPAVLFPHPEMATDIKRTKASRMKCGFIMGLIEYGLVLEFDCQNMVCNG